MIRANPDKVKALVQDIFIRSNVPQEHSAIIADALLDANLSGRASHGILRTKAYVDRLEADGGKPNPDMRILEESETTALLDGDNGLGMVAAYKASKLVREKAEKSGIACVTVKNTNHYGAAAYWAEMIAQEDKGNSFITTK